MELVLADLSQCAWLIARAVGPSALNARTLGARVAMRASMQAAARSNANESMRLPKSTRRHDPTATISKIFGGLEQMIGVNRELLRSLEAGEPVGRTFVTMAHFLVCARNLLLWGFLLLKIVQFCSTFALPSSVPHGSPLPLFVLPRCSACSCSHCNMVFFLRKNSALATPARAHHRRYSGWCTNRYTHNSALQSCS